MIGNKKDDRKVQFSPANTKDDEMNSQWVLKYCSGLNNSGYFLQHIKTQKFLKLRKKLEFKLTDKPPSNQTVEINKYEKDETLDTNFYSIAFGYPNLNERAHSLYQDPYSLKFAEVDMYKKEKLKLEFGGMNSFFDIQLCLSLKKLLKDYLNNKYKEPDVLPFIISALSKASKFIKNKKLSHIKFNAPTLPTRRHIPSRQKVTLILIKII